MSQQTTCEDLTNATSSPESAAGATPFDSPEFQMTDLFGQALAPASRSAPPAPSVAAQMSATYGLRSSVSSASAALQQSLVSRLQALLASRGSTMFTLIWKAQVTPLRRPICALLASAPRTSGSGCTGWPTPMAGTPAQKGKSAAGNNDSSRRTVALASWPTPKAGDSDKGVRTHRGAMKELGRKGLGSDLPTIAAASYATPPVHLISGAMSNGSYAPTEKPGQLNPAFCLCYLMGYPVEWLLAAPSSRPQPRYRKPKRGICSAASAY